MATFLQSGGSMRARSRKCDVASQQQKEISRQRAAGRMLDALDQFEERLAAYEDDLPQGADATRFHRLTTMSDDWGKSTMMKTQSEPHISQGHLEDPIHSRRPPSPLRFYDYGSITLKPLSLYGQQKRRAAPPAGAEKKVDSVADMVRSIRFAPEGSRDTVRPKHRMTSCGFYFPGQQMKQGPYGASLADPILLAPRSWEPVVEPSHRWATDASDARPLCTEEFSRTRSRLNAPVLSPLTRSTNGHTRRARRLFHCLDRDREEAVLEQARFEHGVFEGRWRNPLLDSTAVWDHPQEQFEWLALPTESMTPLQNEAANILFRLEAVAQKTKGRLAQLFVDQNKACSEGLFEPIEFVRGLVKHGAIEDGELTPERLVKVMPTIDCGFEGRVRLPVVDRAVKAARSVRMQQEEAARDQHKQRQVKLSTSYSEQLPVEVIKVDHPASSLLNFNRSFQKFMSQQRDLLIRHGEVQ